MSGRRQAAAWVFVVALAAYLVSPVRQLSDSYYSLLVAEQLASRGTLDLAEHFIGELPPERFPGVRRDGLPYQVKRFGERVLYEFPLGAPLLATPWMAVAHAAGLGVLGEDGRYDRERERRHQRLLAALFSALFAATAFSALDLLTGRRAALWTTAALVLATPLWSTASRGLWSHTAELALLGLALPIVAARERGASEDVREDVREGVREDVRGDVRDRAGGGLRLGLLAAGAYLCRPTASIVILLLVSLLAWQERRAAVRFALGATAGLAAFAALSWATWGTPLPPYYLAARLGLPSLETVAGVLVSPGRGLFVYEPGLLAALVYGAVRFRALAARPLFVVGAAGIALHALVVACFAHWWGGHGYGPRLFTETLFFQVLVAASVVATVTRGTALRRGRGSRPARALAVLAALGVALHAPGALSNQSNRWNWSPAEIDEQNGRLWDWRDPQFLAWLNRGPRKGATIAPSSRSMPASSEPTLSEPASSEPTSSEPQPTEASPPQRLRQRANRESRGRGGG